MAEFLSFTNFTLFGGRLDWFNLEDVCAISANGQTAILI